jgi:virginiamycin B lyase
MTLGPDGNVWFTELAAQQIGKVTPQGSITEYHLPEKGSPLGIATGSDGNLWVTIVGSRTVMRVSPSGEFTAFHTGSDTVPTFIAAGPDGNLWFTEPNGKIARVNTQGQIVEFVVANVASF